MMILFTVIDFVKIYELPIICRYFLKEKANEIITKLKPEALQMQRDRVTCHTKYRTGKDLQ